MEVSDGVDAPLHPAVGFFQCASMHPARRSVVLAASAILALPLTLGAAATAATTGTVSSFGSDEFGQLGNGTGGSSTKSQSPG